MVTTRGSIDWLRHLIRNGSENAEDQLTIVLEKMKMEIEEDFELCHDLELLRTSIRERLDSWSSSSLSQSEVAADGET